MSNFKNRMKGAGATNSSEKVPMPNPGTCVALLTESSVFDAKMTSALCAKQNFTVAYGVSDDLGNTPEEETYAGNHCGDQVGTFKMTKSEKDKGFFSRYLKNAALCCMNMKASAVSNAATNDEKGIINEDEFDEYIMGTFGIDTETGEKDPKGGSFDGITLLEIKTTPDPWEKIENGQKVVKITNRPNVTRRVSFAEARENMTDEQVKKIFGSLEALDDLIANTDPAFFTED